MREIIGSSANAKQAAVKRADMYPAARAAALRRQLVSANELFNQVSHARINSSQVLKHNFPASILMQL
ncbi:hypothetical protein RHS01_01349 [Rhizoctonia solani]|uniref:Uncharacterized protein n=1 Tax=Rhizoctonia solani TaxID=456999 RepID=A0A8H7IKX0_9AGAM|nr:hypothetical protein RHS01_01349 [Rhizoctonia solani]